MTLSRLAVLLLVVLAVALPAAAQVHPTVDRMAPTSGPPGTQVTLVGHGFLRGVAVYLGGVPLPIVRRTPTRLVVRIPEGARSGTLLVTWGDEEERAGEFEVRAPLTAMHSAADRASHRGEARCHRRGCHPRLGVRPAMHGRRVERVALHAR
jgi:hypothetical protein